MWRDRYVRITRVDDVSLLGFLEITNEPEWPGYSASVIVIGKKNMRSILDL